MKVNSGLTDIIFNEEIFSERRAVYPYNLKIFDQLKTISLHEQVTFFTGENGSGKSTLLEAIAVHLGFNPEGGSKNFNFSTRNSHSGLHSAIRIGKGSKKFKDGYFLRGESFFNVGTALDDLAKENATILDFYGGKSLHEQSHGESFWSLFINRFFGSGLYILDEPEAALSPERQLAFLVRLHDLARQNSQFIIVTHSPILLSYPHSVIYAFGDDGIRQARYTETAVYQTYHRFLNDHERMLKELLGDGL